MYDTQETLMALGPGAAVLRAWVTIIIYVLMTSICSRRIYEMRKTPSESRTQDGARREARL